jgi:hypothetical protein
LVDGGYPAWPFSFSDSFGKNRSGVHPLIALN